MLAFMLFLFRMAFHVISVTRSGLQFFVAHCTLEKGKHFELVRSRKFGDWGALANANTYWKGFSFNMSVHVSSSHARRFVRFIANRAFVRPEI